jgi:alanyl-tRNA synthetase
VVEIPGVDVEACAGTHVQTTGDIGIIKVLRTERVQDGVERIEFSVADAAIDRIQENDDIIRTSSQVFGVDAEQLPKTCDRFFNEWKEQQKVIKNLEKELAAAKILTLQNDVQEVNGYRVLTQIIDADAGQLRGIATNLVEKEQVADIAIVINNQGNIVASSNEKIVEKGFKMGDAIKIIGEYLGGRGGGKPNLAQGAGMTQLDKKDEAFDRIIEEISNLD